MSKSTVLTLVPQVRGSNIPLKENLSQPFHGLLFAGQLQCPRRNISSADAPIEFSEKLNDVLQVNPELRVVGERGAMEATKKVLQSCLQVKSVLVDINKGMRWKYWDREELYFDHYICACKPHFFLLSFAILKSSSTVRMTRNNCFTPVSSIDVSCPSFDTRNAMIKATLVSMETPQNHKHAKANVSAIGRVILTVYKIFCLLFKALIRDGFPSRCVISGQYDVTFVQRSKELELELKRDADASACYSECALIFPESTNAKISGNNATDKVYSFPIFLDVFFIIIPTWA